MNKKYQCALFIFRRDLRLEDNTALIEALRSSQQVIPCFIFDPRQYRNNAYKSEASIQFMLESLQDLQEQLRVKKAELFLFDGVAEEVVEKIIHTRQVDAIFFNRDYTPFSLKRDQEIIKIGRKNNVCCEIFDDALLHAPEETLKSDKIPYQVFSHFYRHAKTLEILKPQKNNYKNYDKTKISFSVKSDFFKKVLKNFNKKLVVHGGRASCLQQLRLLRKLNYPKWHNYPAKNSTSRLSAHLKFTTCSVREIYFLIKKEMTDNEEILREIYWRDFFTMIGFYFPRVFEGAFREKYNAIVWKKDSSRFLAWCEGKTGFPIVDAGMRELNTTGYMHNRVRLITASFLVKHLHIDWRQGEKYFAQKLVDYDPAVNNGNWQWVASTGTDAQPYFRIFNPWLQQRKFDADCEYIKRWVPELAKLDKKIIHQWFKEKYHHLLSAYPPPIVQHAIEAAKAKQYYGLTKLRNAK